MALRPGERFGQYEIVAPIGAGGMGEVYRAHDANLRRDVAIKVLPADLTGDAERRSRFLREARAAAAVNHPNIATVYEVNEADGTTFIAMELVEGKTLRSLLLRGVLPLEDALRLAVEMAEGLTHAHEANVIHRDLKPENVIVRPDGHPKILDFGLAKLLDQGGELQRSQMSKAETVTGEMTREGKILGTAAYMSPEQARGETVDARSDIFSFGTMLFEMVTGKHPFHGKTQMDKLASIINQPAAHASQLSANVPAELDRIVAKCLEKDPGQRYQHTDDLTVDLRKLRQLETSGARTIPPAPEPSRRGWVLPLAVGIALQVGAEGLLIRRCQAAIQE